MSKPERQASASTVLVGAARALLYQLGKPDLLGQACRITHEVLEADLVVALVGAGPRGPLFTKAQYGLTDDEWAVYQIVEFDEPTATVIRERLGDVDVSVLDVTQEHVSAEDNARRSIARKMGIGPMLLLAFRPGGVLTGALVVCRQAAKGPFDQRAIEVASGLVPLLGASLENQRLFDDLDAVNRAQADFLASMSHELRTPLHVITGYVDMLLDDQAGPLSAEQRAFVERIRSSALRQLALVGEAFEMSRRDARGNVPVRQESVALQALLAEIAQEVALRPLPPSVRLVWTAPDDEVRILSDPVKLGMIVRNLVENAITFTAHGEIRVRLRREDGHVVCEVEDTGIGIPEADRACIFEAFRQVEGATSKGLGLGLYIVRRLAAVLQGTVDVESRVGEGSRFTVRIPVARPVS